MAQRFIEVVIGRLVTDEEFRSRFVDDPHGALTPLLDRGIELTSVEIAALVDTDARLWELIADRVDPRLQKTNLKS